MVFNKGKEEGGEEGEQEKGEVTTRTTQSWTGREVRKMERVDLDWLGGGSMNMLIIHDVKFLKN